MMVTTDRTTTGRLTGKPDKIDGSGGDVEGSYPFARCVRVDEAEVVTLLMDTWIGTGLLGDD